MLAPALRATPDEETPTPTPSPTAPEATPEPSPTATPAASPASTPVPTAKPRVTTLEPIRATSPAPAGTRAPAPAATEDDDEEPEVVDNTSPSRQNLARTVSLLRRLETQWEKSAHDEKVIKRIVADDFIGVSPDGKVLSKSSLLRRARRMEPPGKSASTGTRSMNVRMFGPRVAVVTGVARESGRDKEGKKFRLNFRFTDTWMERDGKWQCVASHAMLLPK